MQRPPCRAGKDDCRSTHSVRKAGVNLRKQDRVARPERRHQLRAWRRRPAILDHRALSEQNSPPPGTRSQTEIHFIAEGRYHQKMWK
jgi:hypothetical protein